MKSKVLLAIVIGLLTTYGISRLLKDEKDPTLKTEKIQEEEMTNVDEVYLMKATPEEEIAAFSLDYGDTILMARKTSHGWNTSNGRTLSTEKVATYLNGFSALSDSVVITDFDEMRAVNLPQQSLLLENIQLEVPIEIFVFHDTTRLDWPIIIRSSYARDTYFGSDSSGLYQKIIKPIGYFF